MLANCAKLFRLLFQVCPNGVLPTLKLIHAILKCHAAKPIFESGNTKSGSDPTVWAPNVGALLRAIAKNFRDINGSRNECNLKTCLRKVFNLLVARLQMDRVIFDFLVFGSFRSVCL